MASATTPTRPLRRLAPVVAIACALALLAGCLTEGQDAVLRELNADRRAHGRRELSLHDQATAKAQAWAEKLARENRLYHSNLSSGITTRWCALGENVGYGSSPAAVQDAYMASAAHRANVLSTTWNGVGVGHAVRGSRHFTVQVFIKTC